MTSLTKRYRFSASHRLHVPELSAAENLALFGKCNNPFGHGHDYTLSVTVAGEADASTGLIVHVESLDRLVEQEVLGLFAHRNINQDILQFAEMVPTTENIALLIAELLQNAWAESFGDNGRARLASVHVQETERNGFDVILGSRQTRTALRREQESTTVHG